MSISICALRVLSSPWTCVAQSTSQLLPSAILVVRISICPGKYSTKRRCYAKVLVLTWKAAKPSPREEQKKDLLLIYGGPSGTPRLKSGACEEQASGFFRGLPSLHRSDGYSYEEGRDYVCGRLSFLPMLESRGIQKGTEMIYGRARFSLLRQHYVTLCLLAEKEGELWIILFDRLSRKIKRLL